MSLTSFIAFVFSALTVPEDSWLKSLFVRWLVWVLVWEHPHIRHSADIAAARRIHFAFIIFVIPFASLKAQTSYEKMLYLSTIWFIIPVGNSNTLQSTEGGVANLFRPRIIICAVILSSTNKWDFEPGLLSLVINHVYSVTGWQSLLLFLFIRWWYLWWS